MGKEFYKKALTYVGNKLSKYKETALLTLGGLGVFDITCELGQGKFFTGPYEYTGPEQIDRPMGFISGGIASFNVGRYIEDKNKGRKRSPLTKAGMLLEVGGPIYAAIQLQLGKPLEETMLPGVAAIGIGAILEGVGIIHEKISPKYRT
jgi:hypothetical protein